MAVAVKNSPETKTRGLMDRLALASLGGLVYLLGALGIVFRAVPALWDLLGLPSNTFLSVALLGTTMLGGLIFLAVMGNRLLGREPRPGLKAGIFTSFVLLFVVVMLTRWIGGLLEGSTYSRSWFSSSESANGSTITLVVGGVLLLLMLRVFFRRGFENWLVKFEQQGWFSTSVYKLGQGQRVRRGTILGILIIAGSGISSLINHNTFLGNWQLDLPFTGRLVVEDIGDGKELLAKENTNQFRVLATGNVENLTVGAETTREEAKKYAVDQASLKKAELDKLVGQLLDALFARLSPQNPGLAKNLPAMKTVAAKTTDREVLTLISWVETLQPYQAKLSLLDDESNLLELFLVQREIDRTIKEEQKAEQERKRVDPEARKNQSLEKELSLMVNWASANQLPVIAPVLDRFRARDINQQLDPLVQRIVTDPTLFADLPKDYQFKEGAIVGQNDFDNAVEELKKRARDRGASDAEVNQQEEKARRDAPPTRPLEGSTVYSSFLLLPSTQFTMPLLLMALTLWLAWRVVNLPVFADFLIATEAELNKVSWTTRSRLYQDTMVVLCTMVLMSAFLFVVDVVWAKTLSWRYIGVLQVSTQETDKEKDAELRW